MVAFIAIVALIGSVTAVVAPPIIGGDAYKTQEERQHEEVIKELKEIKEKK